MSDELASKPVTLECPRSGDKLVCYAERIAVVGGERYLVAFPKVRAYSRVPRRCLLTCLGDLLVHTDIISVTKVPFVRHWCFSRPIAVGC